MAGVLEADMALVEETLDHLRANRMGAQYVPDRGAARAAVAALLRPGDRVAVGGSVTLEETGILELLRSGGYAFIDRYEQGLSEQARRARFLAAFQADALLCSANAVTRGGELYQVDGLGNRVAPLVYGPGRVIVVAGVNKLVADVPAAVRRVREITAPAIVRRRGLDAPCARLGRCVAADDPDPAAGCGCDARRCCSFLLLGRQREEGRIQVVLVGESLGF